MKAVYPSCCPTPVCPEENTIEGSSGPADPSSAYGAWPQKDAWGHKSLYGGYPYPPALPY